MLGCWPPFLKNTHPCLFSLTTEINSAPGTLNQTFLKPHEGEKVASQSGNSNHWTLTNDQDEVSWMLRFLLGHMKKLIQTQRMGPESRNDVPFIHWKRGRLGLLDQFLPVSPNSLPSLFQNNTLRNIFVQKPRIIPPLTKLGGCITGTKPDQRHKKKKSPLILKHNSVKNSGIL